MIKKIVFFFKKLFRIKTKIEIEIVSDEIRKKRIERRLDFIYKSAKLEGLE